MQLKVWFLSDVIFCKVQGQQTRVKVCGATQHLWSGAGDAPLSKLQHALQPSASLGLLSLHLTLSP